MSKKKLLLLWLTTLVSLSLMSQRIITGSVKSGGDNADLAGAAVQVVGTTYGAKTDANGNFKISLPENIRNVQLKASYLGYKFKTINLGAGDNTANITLEEDRLKIDEVVVTAIGIKKEKKSLGYSTQEVKSEEITKAAQGDAFKGLEGKVAGLQVTQASGVAGAGVNMRLRGPVSISGSNQPLMVVDGIIIDNSQNYSGNPNDGANNLLGANGSVSSSNRGIDLNPEDIESVNVLKGAAAAALYGSQASNGAIIITTKKGRSRTDAKKGVSIQYNTSFSLDNINKYVPLQNKYSQGSAGKYADPATSTGSGTWGALIDTLRYWKDPAYTWSSYGRIVGMSNANAGEKVTPFDNQRNFFEQGYTTDHNVAIVGGSEKNQFRVSVSDRYQKGVIPNNYYNRFTINTGGNFEISDKFNMSVGVNYVKSDDNKIQQGSNTSGLMLGLLRTPPTFDNANGASDPNSLSANSYAFANGSQRAYRRNAAYDNPYWGANQNFYKEYLDRVFGSVQANWTISPFIILTGRVGTDWYSDRRHQYIELGSAALNTGSNRNDVYTNQVTTADVYATMPFKMRNNWNSTYIVGANLYDANGKQNYVEGNSLIQPGFANMTNASSFVTYELPSQHRRYSLYGMAKYDWLNKLYLEGTLRMDKTSSLEKGFNTYLYPSLSVGYVFSEDMVKHDFLSYGKVRGSFAMVGKDAPIYGTKNYFGSATIADPWAVGTTFPYNGVAGYQAVNVAGNPTLKNEFVYNYELGTELKFWQNRLGIDISAYYNRSTDQIILADVSPATGYAAALINAGSMQNIGLEIVLNATPVKLKDFRWDVNVNWSLNRSKILSLTEGLNTLSLGGFASTTINHVVGMPYGQIYTTDWYRDASGNMIIDDDPTSSGYGKPFDDPTPKAVGDPNPNFIMGIGNTLTYKRWTLSGLLSWKNGGQMWNGTKGTLITMGVAEETNNRGTNTVFSGVAGHLNANGELVHYAADGVTEIAGAGATNAVSTPLNQAWYQGNGGGFGNVQSQFVENTDFLKLRELSLSYAFDTKSWKTFKNLEIGAFIRNVLIWTPYTGIDPEQSLTGASNIQGIDYYNMPGIRSFGLKAKVGF